MARKKLRIRKPKKLTLVQRGLDGVTRLGAGGQAFQRDLAFGVTAGGSVLFPPLAVASPVILGANELGYRATLGVTNAARQVGGLQKLERRAPGQLFGVTPDSLKGAGQVAVQLGQTAKTITG